MLYVEMFKLFGMRFLSFSHFQDFFGLIKIVVDNFDKYFSI